MGIDVLDRRASQWAWPLRWLYVGMKWSLVVLGAACLVYSWGSRMGWSAAIWFLAFPLGYGIWEGLIARYAPRDSPPPDQELP